MIQKSLAIAILFIASVVWAGDLTDTEKERLKVVEEKIIAATKEWQNDLESGPVGRFQAVTAVAGNNASGVFILDTKEGRLWVAGAPPGTSFRIVYIGQVNPYSLPGK